MDNKKKTLGRDPDTVKGAGHKIAGKAKEALGNLTGNQETKAEGKAEHARGTVQEGVGKIKDTVRGVAKGAAADSRSRKKL